MPPYTRGSAPGTGGAAQSPPRPGPRSLRGQADWHGAAVPLHEPGPGDEAAAERRRLTRSGSAPCCQRRRRFPASPAAAPGPGPSRRLRPAPRSSRRPRSSPSSQGRAESGERGLKLVAEAATPVLSVQTPALKFSLFTPWTRKHDRCV